MHLNLRGKIFAYVALPVVLILGGAEAFRVKQLYDGATESTIEQEQVLALSWARELDARLREAARIAQDSAVFLELHPQVDPQTLFKLVHANVGADPIVYGAAIAFVPQASPTGGLFSPYAFRKSADTIAVMDIGRDGYDYTAKQWQWWHRPLELGHGVWTDAYLDEGAGGIMMVTFSVPFRRAGVVAGVATVDVGLPDLRKRVFRSAASEHKLFVIGADERMVFAHNSAEIGTPLVALAAKLARPDILELGREMLKRASQQAGHLAAQGWDAPGEQLIFYAQVESPKWVLGLRVDKSAVFADARAQLERAIFAMLAALAFITVGLMVVTRRVTDPLARLDAAAQRVAQGDMAVDIEPKGDDEIARLSRSFTHMAQALVEREQALVAETAAREKIETELALAKELQRSMLPPAQAHDAAFGRYDIAAVLEPARAVGGDFFDYVVTADGRLMFVIADVSDKGVPAALFMVRAHTLLRSLAQGRVSPSALLATMNDALCADNDRCMFVTLACGALDLASGRLEMSNAGHEPTLRVRADGRLEWLAVDNGPALGLIEGTPYPGAEFRLDAGDALVLYTDGVSEAFDPEKRAFGRDGLEIAVKAQAQASALDLCAGVIAEVRRFVGGAEQSDDLTLLVMRWHGSRP